MERAKLVMDTLDCLREVGTSHLPLRVQAANGAIASIAAAAQHRVGPGNHRPSDTERNAVSVQGQKKQGSRICSAAS